MGELKKDVAEGINEISWTVSGKIKEIDAVGTNKDLKFDYDAMGNRIAKHVYSSGNNWEKSIYYLRDAQGNVLSVYEYGVNQITKSPKGSISTTHLLLYNAQSFL